LPRAMASLCSWAARRLAWRESPARSHGVAELLAGGPAEVGVGGLAGLAGGGGDSGQADQRFGVGNRARQSPVPAGSRAARMVRLPANRKA